MEIDNNRLRQGRTQSHVKRNERCAALAIVVGGCLTIILIILSQWY